VLIIRGLSAGYGDIQVLHEVNLTVDKGELIALLGANAAGKTTLINCISGLVKETSGTIEFEGDAINALTAYERVNRGLIQVCEGRNLFPLMTVAENLQLGAYSQRARQRIKENLEMVYSFLPILFERRKQKAGSLSGGQQQMVAIGRGLMADPKILMLDEPSLGLAPVISQAVFETVQKIKEQGVTILLVEQNVVKALQMASRGYVLENGRINSSGSAGELLDDDGVRKAYMGI